MRDIELRFAAPLAKHPQCIFAASPLVVILKRTFMVVNLPVVADRVRAPIFAFGTVVILSTIRRQVPRSPLRSFGSTRGRNSGACLDPSRGHRRSSPWLRIDNLFSSGSKRLNAFYIFRFEIPLCHFQVVMNLKIHPEFWAIAEVQAQAKRRVSRDAPSIIDNLGDTVWRDPDGLRELALR
jgi:hypothetical protein